MTHYTLYECPARSLSTELLPESVACAVFSPPYNISAPYDGYDDQLPWFKYRDMAEEACEAMWYTLKPGGRVWCNVQATVPTEQPKRDGKNRQNGEARTNLAWIWENALRNNNFQYRDTVVWDQDRFDGGTAWGSYRKPSAPNLRGAHELILCYYKPPYKRETPPEFKGWQDPFGKEDWPELTRNIWKLGTARSKDHTAIFPVELPSRCIRLSTWPGETVLDLFCGSGTTGVAALQLGRRFVGFDISPASLKVAEARLQSEEAEEKKAGSE